MSADATARVRALRATRAAQGLKRREVYAHPDDWPAIRALADRLALKRTAEPPCTAPRRPGDV